MIKDNKIILTCPGHKRTIRTIRYFINKKNNNEYLISGSIDKEVIIWDINNNYKIIQRIDTKYEKGIYSCLLIFPDKIDDRYIITSNFYKSQNNENSATKVYSLNNNKLIKYINNTNTVSVYYLLHWYNKNRFFMCFFW